MSNRLRASLAVAVIFLFLLTQPSYAGDKAILLKYQSLISSQTPELSPHLPFLAPKDISDHRLPQLESYLRDQKSPLVDHAKIFIAVADKYNLDWRFLPAISGLESSFGTRLPHGSYNPFGWSGGSYRFISWEDSINHVGQYLSEKYFGRGLNTIEKIAPVYCPGSNTWAPGVRHFMEQISEHSPSS